MATQTSKLKLTKPAYTDTADIQVVNVNMDIVDGEFVKVEGELKKVNDRVTSVESKVNNIKLEAKNVSIDDVSNKFTSTNVEGALKEVFDKSEQAFQLGVSTKSEMKNAINSKKTVSDVTDNDSWSTYVQRVKDIKEGSGNATVGDVLSGKTFTNNDGVEYTGTMANQPASVSAISVGSDGTNKYFRIPNGAYLTNTQTGYPEIIASATQIDSNIISENIISGKSICGVIGTASIKVTAGSNWLIHHDNALIDNGESWQFGTIRTFQVRNVGSCRVSCEFKGGGNYSSSSKPMVLRYTVKRGNSIIWTSGEHYAYAGSQFDTGWVTGTSDTPSLLLGDVIHVEMKSAFTGDWESGECLRRSRNFQVRGIPYL